jgi:hypothetical protein
MNKIEITKKNRSQIERLAKKLSNEGLQFIDFDDEYDPQKNQYHYFIVGSTAKSDIDTSQIDLTLPKKEIEKDLSYMISGMVKQFTGEKFEEEWEKNKTLEDIIEMYKFPPY